jgi:hypothetical protein
LSAIGGQFRIAYRRIKIKIVVLNASNRIELFECFKAFGIEEVEVFGQFIGVIITHAKHNLRAGLVAKIHGGNLRKLSTAATDLPPGLPSPPPPLRAA